MIKERAAAAAAAAAKNYLELRSNVFLKSVGRSFQNSLQMTPTAY
jgi:hypothetical protein